MYHLKPPTDAAVDLTEKLYQLRCAELEAENRRLRAQAPEDTELSLLKELYINSRRLHIIGRLSEAAQSAP